MTPTFVVFADPYLPSPPWFPVVPSPFPVPSSFALSRTVRPRRLTFFSPHVRPRATLLNHTLPRRHVDLACDSARKAKKRKRRRWRVLGACVFKHTRVYIRKGVLPKRIFTPKEKFANLTKYKRQQQMVLLIWQAIRNHKLPLKITTFIVSLISFFSISAVR